MISLVLVLRHSFEMRANAYKQKYSGNKVVHFDDMMWVLLMRATSLYTVLHVLDVQNGGSKANAAH